MGLRAPRTRGSPTPRRGRSRPGTFATELFAIHPTYVHEAEEEIVFLADAFLSHIPEASCDVPRYRSWVDAQDFAPAYRWLRRMLQLLQWQKRQRGEPAAVRAQDAGPPRLPRRPAAEFPDAHLVHTHRDPVDVIPSGASLNPTLWRDPRRRRRPARGRRQWIERMGWSCDRAVAARARGPGRSGADVVFVDRWTTGARWRVQEAFSVELRRAEAVMSAGRFEGKRALVTGAAGDIGERRSSC